MRQEINGQQPAVRKTPINNDFIVRLNTWCDTQKEITLCETRKEGEVFRYEWFVGWFKDNKELLRLPLLNSPRFKEEWRKFCLQAERARQRFRFMGIYYVRDMERWLLEVSSVREDLLEDEDEAEEAEEGMDVDEALRQERRVRNRDRRRLKRLYDDMMNDDIESEIYKKIDKKMQNILPFGFIEWPRKTVDCYGQYFVKENIVKNSRRIVFECNDPVRQELYNFDVIDFGAKFLSASDPESPYATTQLGTQNDLLPITEYWDLYLDRDAIDETRLAAFDVNSLLAYPEAIPQAKPLPDTPVANIGEDALYSLDSLSRLRQRESAEVQRQTVARVNVDIEAVRRAFCGSGKATYDASGGVMHERKARFNRPYQFEAITPAMGDNITLANLRPPAILLRYEDLQRKYENDICTLMNLPYIFYKPHVNDSGPAGGASKSTKGDGGASGIGGQGRGGGGGGATEANLALYQRILDDERVKQQTIFDGLFKVIYYKTFYLLDKILFAMYAPGLQHQIEPGLRFNNQTVKSDTAVRDMLEFYNLGLLDANHIRPFLFRSLGIEDKPEIGEEEVMRKRMARTKPPPSDQPSQSKKRPVASTRGNRQKKRKIGD